MSIVWLLKSCEESDFRYQDLLSQNGFRAVHVPVLHFRHVNQGLLSDSLNKPQDHNGVIFTSQRAVEAFAEVYSGLSSTLRQEWAEKKVFVIGEATGRAVRKLLKKADFLGQESGRAQLLSEVIVRETTPNDLPLLYPCGNLGRDELVRTLSEHQRAIKALVSYETSKHPLLEASITEAVSNMAGYMVFFSPSGVNFALPALRSSGVDLTKVKVVAIGPTTNEALVKEGVPVAGVCSSPSPEGVLDVLSQP